MKRLSTQGRTHRFTQNHHVLAGLLTGVEPIGEKLLLEVPLDNGTLDEFFHQSNGLVQDRKRDLTGCRRIDLAGIGEKTQNAVIFDMRPSQVVRSIDEPRSGRAAREKERDEQVDVPRLAVGERNRNPPTIGKIPFLIDRFLSPRAQGGSPHPPCAPEDIALPRVSRAHAPPFPHQRMSHHACRPPPLALTEAAAAAVDPSSAAEPIAGADSDALFAFSSSYRSEKKVVSNTLSQPFSADSLSQSSAYTGARWSSASFNLSLKKSAFASGSSVVTVSFGRNRMVNYGIAVRRLFIASIVRYSAISSRSGLRM